MIELPRRVSLIFAQSPKRFVHFVKEFYTVGPNMSIVSLSFLPPLNIDSPKSRIEQGHARWSLTLYFETATRIDGWRRISSIEDRSLEDNNRCWKSIWA